MPLDHFITLARAPPGGAGDLVACQSVSPARLSIGLARRLLRSKSHFVTLKPVHQPRTVGPASGRTPTSNQDLRERSPPKVGVAD